MNYKNVIIPDGWEKRRARDFVHIDDMVYVDKAWIIPRNYGSGVMVGRKLCVGNPLQNELLRSFRDIARKRIETYQPIYQYASRSLDFLVARCLWLAGAETIVPTTSLCGGYKDARVVQVHNSSIIVKPHITHPITQRQTLLYWILTKLDIPYSGGAGDGYMQACTHGKENECFLKEVMYNFHGIKDAMKNVK